MQQVPIPSYRTSDQLSSQRMPFPTDRQYFHQAPVQSRFGEPSRDNTTNYQTMFDYPQNPLFHQMFHPRNDHSEIAHHHQATSQRYQETFVHTSSSSYQPPISSSRQESGTASQPTQSTAESSNRSLSYKMNPVSSQEQSGMASRTTESTAESYNRLLTHMRNSVSSQHESGMTSRPSQSISGSSNRLLNQQPLPHMPPAPFDEMKTVLNKYTGDHASKREKYYQYYLKPPQRFKSRATRTFIPGSSSGNVQNFPDSTSALPKLPLPWMSNIHRTEPSNEPTSSSTVFRSASAVSGPSFPRWMPSGSSSTYVDRAQHFPQKATQSPPPPKVEPPAAPQECIVCNELSLIVTFKPCGHNICCEVCGLRMKKCLKCQSVIEQRVAIDGMILGPKETEQQPSTDRLRYLETKIQEIEEIHCCSICMERRRNVAFLCGHSACSKCADTLKTCHM